MSTWMFGCKRSFCSTGGGGGGGGAPLAVGDRVTVFKRVSQADVADFARLSGDANVVHSGHHHRLPPLVHGVYLAALVSGVIGTRLPGHGAVLVAKRLRFPRPCYVGDRVAIDVEILAVRKLIKCGFRCRVGPTVVVEGTADVVFDGNVAERLLAGSQTPATEP